MHATDATHAAHRNMPRMLHKPHTFPRLTSTWFPRIASPNYRYLLIRQCHLSLRAHTLACSMCAANRQIHTSSHTEAYAGVPEHKIHEGVRCCWRNVPVTYRSLDCYITQCTRDWLVTTYCRNLHISNLVSLELRVRVQQISARTRL